MATVPRLYLKYDDNSCYMDSLLIFIAMYRHTPLFNRFFSIEEADLSKDVRDLKIFKFIKQISGNLYDIARNIYTQLEEGQDDIITCNDNRNNIRLELQDITNAKYKLKKLPITNGINNDDLATYWISDQQDTLDLWAMLKYLFNLDLKINTVPHKGYTYFLCENDNTYLCPKEKQNISDTVKLLTPDQQESYITNIVNFNIELQPTPDTPMYIHKKEVDNVTETKKDLFSDFIEEPGYFSITEDYDPNDVDSDPNMSVIKFSDWMVIDTSSTKLSGDYKNTVICKFAVKHDLPGYVINVGRLSIKDPNQNGGAINNSEEGSEGEEEIELPKQFFNDALVEIQETITNPYTKTTYIFIGGVVHNGFKDDIESSGHYTAYIKNPGTGIYMYYDDIDSKYTEVGDFTKLIADTTIQIQTHCVMLFYIPENDYKHNQQYSKGSRTKNSITKTRFQRKQNKKTRKAKAKARRETLKQTTPKPAPVTAPAPTPEPAPVTAPAPTPEPAPASGSSRPIGSNITAVRSSIKSTPGKINFIQLD